MTAPFVQRSVLLFLAGVLLAGCGGDESTGTASGTEAVPTTTAAASATAPVPAEVPAEYRALYQELSTELEAARERFAKRPGPAERPGPLLALELLTANGNRGEDLLQPANLQATRVFLDRFEDLRAKAVTIQVVYPLFDETFPRHAEYVEFYRAVVREARQRGLLVLIETSAPFAGTEFSSLHVDYAGKTPEVYLQERLQQARVIAHELLPDYLTLAEEQTTERMLTGLAISDDAYLNFLRSARQVIDPPPGVKLGAGSGTWEPPQVVQRIIADTSLDYVDIHVYPLSNGFTDYLKVAAEWASAAGAAGKEAVIGESWLYKLSAQELQAGMQFQQAFGRDAYSFWEPLDVLFMQTMAVMGHASGVSLLSFFWSNYLFAYVDYDQAPRGLTTSEVRQRANLATWRAVTGAELSLAGEEFRVLSSALY